jgi:hypothetical protein
MNKGSNPGRLLVLALVCAAAMPVAAQNLGLGAGSRSSEDSTRNRYGNGDEGTAPRRSQMNKRLGLSARRIVPLDPKVFEARGRELQGRFYEIDAPVGRAEAGGKPYAASARDPEIHRKGGRQWMIWAGVAGLAGASAGVVGYMLMSHAHPTAPPPKDIVLTDGP